MDEGDILFVKKGANLTHQFFDDQFCAVFIFIPDDFIKAFLKRNITLLDAPQKNISNQDAVLRVQKDELLASYYHSVQAYLSLSKKLNKYNWLLSLLKNCNQRQYKGYKKIRKKNRGW